MSRRIKAAHKYAPGKKLEAELRWYHAGLESVPGAPKVGRLHAAATLGKADSGIAGEWQLIGDTWWVITGQAWRVQVVGDHMFTSWQARERHEGRFQ